MTFDPGPDFDFDWLPQRGDTDREYDVRQRSRQREGFSCSPSRAIFRSLMAFSMALTESAILYNLSRHVLVSDKQQTNEMGLEIAADQAGPYGAEAHAPRQRLAPIPGLWQNRLHVHGR
jgi:hypothetical protein